MQTNRPIQFITPEVVELTCQQFEEEKELYAEAHVAAFIRKYGFWNGWVKINEIMVKKGRSDDFIGLHVSQLKWLYTDCSF